jgi:hypothetical protein
MKILNTEQELIDTLRTKKVIVLDQPQQKWIIYNIISSTGYYDEEVSDLNIHLHETLEKWARSGIITRSCFIPKKIEMVISYEIYSESADVKQEQKAKERSVELGLIYS